MFYRYVFNFLVGFAIGVSAAHAEPIRQDLRLKDFEAAFMEASRKYEAGLKVSSRGCKSDLAVACSFLVSGDLALVVSAPTLDDAVHTINLSMARLSNPVQYRIAAHLLTIMSDPEMKGSHKDWEILDSTVHAIVSNTTQPGIDGMLSDPPNRKVVFHNDVAYSVFVVKDLGAFYVITRG